MTSMVSRPRADRLDHIMGLGKFLDDLEIPGVLSCGFVRSTVAHAELVGIDTSDALAAEGVEAVFTHGDLGLDDIPGRLRRGPEAPSMRRPPLARNRLRYVGEPIALVVADDPYRATDGVELILVDLEPLPAVVDPLQALEAAVLLFPESGSNVVDASTTGSVGADQLAVSATVEVVNQRLAPLPLEPLGIVAVPVGDGIHIWCGHQAPHRLRSQISSLLGIDPSHVRVTVPDVGGGFGAKGMLYPEYLVLVAAALHLDRPLKWVETRRENMSGGTHGRGQVHRIELSGDRSGRIRRARIEILANLGAYPHNGSMIPGITAFMAPGPYQIEELAVGTTMVVTNTAPVGTYRGAGRPEASYAIERAVDAFARAAGLEPIEVRRVNLIPEISVPLKTPTGALYDSGNYVGALDTALELAGLDLIRSEQVRRQRMAATRLGVGASVYVERAGGPIHEGEFAAVEIGADGTMTVRAGAVDTGQGHDRLWRKLAGAPFDLPENEIRVVSGDTGEVKAGVGTFASRSTQVCGSVVARCAARLHDQVQEIAAVLLEASPSDLVSREGSFELVDGSGTSVSLADVARHATELGMDLTVEETWAPGAHTFPYGAHVAVVEVDTETGDVRLCRAIAVDDCGNVMDHAGTAAQVHGSMAQGVGQARFEEIRYDDTGQPLTASLVDYLVPRAPDLPIFETAHLVSPAPSNPLGAKGVGESGCIGFPPALISAIVDALGSMGVSHIDMPAQPQNVWSAINAASR